ncbi:MAG TPA: VacJ family lipoprotein [Syntrophobacteraceae bacterium]|nr:VacJ family lipoprotein [Syntrophobacteraceae bacterium]
MAGRKIALSSIIMAALLLSLPTFRASRIDMPLSSWLGVAHAQVGNYDALRGGSEEDTVERMADPLEPVNRFWFKFNDRLYSWVLKPIAKAYKTVIPEPARVMADNAFYNFRFPIRFVNNLLQLKLEGAGTELLSFVVNSTVGCGGMFDPAQKEFHLKRYKEDFGQTLGYYRMPPVIYIVWPFLGPSSLRDTLGRAADSFTSGLYWLSYFEVLEWYESAGFVAWDEVNYMSLHLGEYEDFKRAALDPYVAMRSVYYQYRENLIRE